MRLPDRLDRMPSRRPRPSVPALALPFAAGLALIAAAPPPAAAGPTAPIGSAMSLPIPDAARGRTLFVSKGCVVCHAVNGVGGAAAPALDATEPAGVFDPLDFAARMWKGAWAMSALQEMEFGYVIELTGQDIADLAAFAEHHALQSEFSEDDIPETIRGWTLDAPLDPSTME